MELERKRKEFLEFIKEKNLKLKYNEGWFESASNFQTASYSVFAYIDGDYQKILELSFNFDDNIRSLQSALDKIKYEYEVKTGRISSETFEELLKHHYLKEESN